MGPKWDRIRRPLAGAPSRLSADDANVEVGGKADIVHRERVLQNPSPGAYIWRSRNADPKQMD
jgi:hypothetical protein